MESTKPRDRPPQGLVDGVMTPEALEKAAVRLEKHRMDCRERYRRTQDTLKEQRPELFAKRNGRRAGGAVRETQLPISQCVLQSPAQEGHSGATGRRDGVRKVPKRKAGECTSTEV